MSRTVSRIGVSAAGKSVTDVVLQAEIITIKIPRHHRIGMKQSVDQVFILWFTI